jgi:hypothetical protein
MKTSLTYRQPQTAPMGGYPFASDADYGCGRVMFVFKP